MSVTSFIGNDVEYDFVVLGGSVASLSGNSLMQTVHTHCACHEGVISIVTVRVL